MKEKKYVILKYLLPSKLVWQHCGLEGWLVGRNMFSAAK